MSMSQRTAFLALAVLLGPGLARAAGPPVVDGEKLFALRVWPVLKTRCLPCHGDDPRKIRGGLDLTTRAGLLTGGDSGKPGIVSGNPGHSPVVRAVTRTDESYSAMPP